ncbi:hypothetical protein JTB14_016063 [Gonioctena quinquepunctata]|nr:hypothetical protein JTB14_016063 [Gonioctena quinquepunctata]
MQGSAKIPITDLNEHITCKICNGYFVDATTIIECLHTFCRSCIVKYLEKNKYCPVCDVQVHKTKPLLNIRPDKTLQDIVYKLVPRLFHNEMQKRRAFYESHPESKPSSLEQCGEAAYQHLLTPEETVCLTLGYHGSEDKPRYLRCPAAVSMAHLIKLIRAKYDLSDSHRVDILYNQDCLNSSLTLMDVAYIYLWKRKGPIELTYRIYECTSKKPKLEPEYVEITQVNNNNNWKEVQLRISENGEMSITGIQDGTLSPSLLEIVNSEPKYKNEEAAPESKSSSKSVKKKELPGLKFIGKGNSPNSSAACTMVSVSSMVTTNISTTSSNCPPKLKIDYQSITLVPPNTSIAASTWSTIRPEMKPICTNTSSPLKFEETPVNVIPHSNVSATLSSATTTIVYSTINTSKCSTKCEDVYTVAIPPPEMSPKQEKVEEKSPTSSLSDSSSDKSLKRKNVPAPDIEPPVKQSKPTILNHSLGLQNLSSNHPLKKHSKLNRNGENVKDITATIAIPSEVEMISGAVTSKTSSVMRNVNTVATSEPCISKQNSPNKNFTFVQSQLNRPGTPLSMPKLPAISVKSSTVTVKPPSTSYSGVKPPCYMPKSSYNPVINVPKPVTSTNPNHCIKTEPRPSQEVCASSSYSPVKSDSNKPITTSSQQCQQMNIHNSNSKLCTKQKPSIPMSYKTLRDPPKSWNSQISKANVTKSSPEPKYSDLKNVRPAKFFKMRNNMPRYLGNPASGVKPMYQLHVSPEKDKNQDAGKTEKSEIKKHSIVKIDPKTLRPISEKAPETTSLSNHCTSNQSLSSNHNYSNQSMNSLSNNMTLSLQNDLKINTSSVSIFSPLKLQSSPKNERKSPKSPHSPKPKSNNNSPTGSKRDKVNLTFTPSNPFIPNLTSPTMSPNQFLYPTGPPGFPAYDPRVMAAYHNLWYGQRMPFPTAPMPGLSLDLNQQRKNLEMMTSPASPKMSALSQAMHNHQVSSRPTTTISNISSISRTHNILSSQTHSKPPNSSSKKTSKDSKSEKSLENAVEKLTQNRHKAIGSKIQSSVSVCASKTSEVERKEKYLSKQSGNAKVAKDSGDSTKNMAKENSHRCEADLPPSVPHSNSSVLASPENNFSSVQFSKSDTESSTSSDKSKKDILGISTTTPSANIRSLLKNDSSKGDSDEKALKISQREHSLCEISSSEIKTEETPSSEWGSSENGSANNIEIPKLRTNEVSSKPLSDKGVQDNSISVNTISCMGKGDEGVTGSSVSSKENSVNDSNQCKEETVSKDEKIAEIIGDTAIRGLGVVETQVQDIEVDDDNPTNSADFPKSMNYLEETNRLKRNLAIEHNYIRDTLQNIEPLNIAQVENRQSFLHQHSSFPHSQSFLNQHSSFPHNIINIVQQKIFCIHFYFNKAQWRRRD